MKRKEKKEETDKLKRIKIDYLNSTCEKINEAKAGNNDRVPHKFIKNLVDIAKPTFPWLSRDVINKHLKLYKKTIAISNDNSTVLTPTETITTANNRTKGGPVSSAITQLYKKKMTQKDRPPAAPHAEDEGSECPSSNALPDSAKEPMQKEQDRLISHEHVRTAVTTNKESSRRGRIMIIAGGTDGIGYDFLKAEVERSSAKYSKIYILGRDFIRIRQLLTQQIRNEDDGAKCLPEIVELMCDITNIYEIQKSLEKINENSINDFVLTIGSFHRGKIVDIMKPQQEGNNNDNIDINKDDVVANHFHLNCVSTIHLIRSIITKLVEGDSQILVCTASLAVMARSPYGLQSATKAALRSFVDTLRIELTGKLE